MSVEFVVTAQPRTDAGKGASRRLRRQGLVPAILYGGHKEPANLTIEQNQIIKQLDNEAFYSHILTLDIGGRKERAVLRDMQRHPYKPLVQHMDFQRVTEDETIRVQIPLHFVNEEACKGVKDQGGAISHLLTEVEIECLPKDLPEFIEVDVLELEMGQTLHLSELKLPEGVTLTALAHGEHDTGVVNVHHVTRVADDTEAADEAEDTED
ncbi:MAG: 50S ribosomal protein L25/general stress protein Ctc [Gammaproteobacteria bacterium]